MALTLKTQPGTTRPPPTPADAETLMAPTMTATAMPVTSLDTLPTPPPSVQAGMPSNIQTITGSDFVATAPAAPAGGAFSPANVVSGISGQFQTPAGPSAIDAVRGISDAFTMAPRPSATDTTMGALDQLLSGGGSYMQNAQRRGLEAAGARGLLNSSIASGAAQRSAVESSMPILNQIMGLQGQREQQDWQANQANRAAALGLTEQERTQDFQRTQNLVNQAMDLTRQREAQGFQAQESQLGRTQQVNNALLDAQLRTSMMEDEALKTDWLNSRDFSRQFNANLSMLPIKSAVDMTTAITQFALQDPELYTPQVVSGMSEFFNRNMLAIMQQYFPTSGGTP